MEESTFHLLVDGVRVTDGRLPNGEGSSLDLHHPVFLGADPSKHTKVGASADVSVHTPVRQEPFFPPQGHDVPVDSVIGCVRNFKMNEEVPRGPEASHRAPPCFGSLTEAGTYFGGGYVGYGPEAFPPSLEDTGAWVVPVNSSVPDKPLDAGPQFELVFELRPRRLSGLLFRAESGEASLSVFLNETEVKLPRQNLEQPGGNTAGY